MPVSVARQIEFRASQIKPRPDIKLIPILLTQEQVEHYVRHGRHGLPGMFVKDTDRRKENWEAAHGTESVRELDALEALYPGELRRIVEDYIHQYRDNDLPRRIASAQDNAFDLTSEFINGITQKYEVARADLQIRIEEVIDRYQAELDDLAERFADDIAPFQPELENLWQAMRNDLDQFNSRDLPAVPDPELPPDTTEWLLDTSRAYFEQLRAYKKHQGKEIPCIEDEDDEEQTPDINPTWWGTTIDKS
jgi:hypothetical protein